MLRVGFDMDGVVADFRTAFLNAAADVVGRQAIRKPSSPLPDFDAVTPADAKKVWKAIAETPNWWLGLPPYEPAQIARLYQLARRFRWEVSFLTSRIPSAGDSVQFQSQTWLEAHGFYLPSVVTVPGSRGEIANALRLDVVIDDQFLNCLEVVGASQTKAILILRMPDAALERQATERGIGIVHRLEDVVDLLLQLHDVLPQKRGAVLRLADWFRGRDKDPASQVLPMDPRTTRPIPPLDE